MTPNGIVTLTTDFGVDDTYLAQMKGVILSLTPQAKLVDVSHAVPPQDVRRGAAVLREVVEAFPAGTVHLCVVDPGVGSARRIVAAAIGGQGFVAPDNGVLSDVSSWSPPTEIVTIERLHRGLNRAPSSTFHGRDLMAPAAALWAGGAALSSLGSTATTPLVRLPDLEIEVSADEVRGEIVWIDRFGNAVTSIPADALSNFSPQTMTLTGGECDITGLSRFYAERDDGEPLVLIGSSGRLEISVRNGHAADRFALTRGMTVIVRRG